MEDRRALGHDASDADPAVAARMAEVADPWPGSIELRTDRPPAAVLEDAAVVVAARPTV